IGRVKESFLLWSAMSCASIQMVDALRLSISSIRNDVFILSIEILFKGRRAGRNEEEAFSPWSASVADVVNPNKTGQISSIARR
ncbi:hypothetical protein, partial [Enterobacter hormaechei]|uniref:hypothetical protein n=1 Tax=Enterobacter hormaechei TaxID=158836 RepID=UPI001C537A90